MPNMFTSIKSSLAKTREKLFGSLQAILPFGSKITDAVLDEVEEALYEADLGPHAAEMLIRELRNRAGDINRGATDPWTVMREAVEAIITRPGERVQVRDFSPYVISVIGVNGAGKTTTIGKLARRFTNEGRTVLLAACDTFRAAATEQLEVWAERAGAEFIKAHPGADAASVAYDAIMRAKARATDVVIVDTAGRLHTSRNLMDELRKIHKVIAKAMDTAPHETLLVLDASTGQNALRQAEVFGESMNVTGIVLAKLDGTAKGGVAVSIIDKLGIPVKLVGTGESIDDLGDFDPAEFAKGLFER
jgi:fused signal recognition particle receptor